MARHKAYDYSQGKFIPIHFDRQILPGTFEYALHYLIDNEIDLSVIDRNVSRPALGGIGGDRGPRLREKMKLPYREAPRVEASVNRPASC